MKYKLIGPPTSQVGKTLWEIVGNLKNLGAGRVVVKDYFARYPETSFYKLVKVQPADTPTKIGYYRKTYAWTELVFRGEKIDDERAMIRNGSAFPCFRLIPKSEEAKYFNYEPFKKLPAVAPYLEWPPVLQMLLARKAQKRGTTLGLLKTVATEGHIKQPKGGVEIQKTYIPHLYKTDKSVEEMVHEIGDLKKKIEMQQIKADI